MEDIKKERLQKFLAEAGIASRRKCEELIMQGKVSVNGKVIKQLGTKINPEIDKVYFEGRLLEKQQKNIYILLNKPIGYVSTADEQFERDKVLDLVNIKERIVPVRKT